MPKFLSKLINKIKAQPVISAAIGLVILIIIINLNAIFRKMLNPPQLINAPNFTQPVDLDTEFVLEFDQSPENIKVVFHPALKNEVTVAGNVLVIQPQQLLNEQTEYQLELKLRNQTINTLSFTTRVMNETEIILKDTESALEKAPLIKYLPLDTPKYYMAYIGPLELGVKIKQGTQAEIEAEVKAWIESKGMSPDSHSITFQTTWSVSPSPATTKTPLLELNQ